MSRTDPVASDDIVSLDGVSKDFGQGTVVHELTMNIRRGEFFSLLGPSGCGKTTTLRILAGFEHPTAGRVVLDGRDVTGVPPNRRPVNTVFQSYALFSHLDVAGNVEFGLREDRVPKRERTQRARQALAMVALADVERRRPSELSGGQQQRVALARAIVKRPRVLLLDEPLGALDLKLRKAMQVELKQLQERLDITFVYVTHDQEEALTMSDRIAVMDAGRIQQVDTPSAIYDRPANRYVADFVGAANCVAGQIGGRSPEGFEFAIGNQVVRSLQGVRSAASARGRHGWMVIRPERCRLVERGQPGQRLRGRVTRVLFHGTHHSYEVRVDPDLTLSVAEQHGPSVSAAYEAGDEVAVGWAAEDAWVVTE